LVSHDRTFLDNVVTQVIVAEGDGQWREYIGGYSDWERVRPSAAQLAAAKSGSKPDPKPAAAVAQAVSTMAPKQKKLSYKEQRELEELPALIAKLEDEQKAISGQLNDPDLYKKKPDEIKRLNERFAQLDAQLLESLEKWEAIEARSQG
jgi:ATP-binding cassette subfamily F protein uup